MKIAVSETPIDDLLRGPLGGALSTYAAHAASANQMSGAMARNAGAELEDYVAGFAAIALQHIAWSMLSASGGTENFDPVAFGKAAERIARETIPLYVARCEQPEATKQ